MSSNIKFKTRIGGQAVLEGIAMKGVDKTCLAVRTPQGDIHTELYETKRPAIMKVPVIRGPVAMISSMIAGVKYINKSADIAFPEESSGDGEKKDSWSGVIGVLLGALLAVGLFVLLPTYATSFISDNLADLGGYKTLVEAVLKIVIFIGYLFAVTRLKDIRRVFEYHGAEHKTIFCYENGKELTVENARECSRFHPRCGTSFLFLVIIISIVIASFIPWGNALIRSAIKVAVLPVTMGLAYEAIQFCGRCDCVVTRILSAPGLWMQRLTTFEPDDSELEVAIASLKAVLPDDPSEAEW